MSTQFNVFLAKYKPKLIFHLAGQSSVGMSFEDPEGTFSSIVTTTQNLLDAIRQQSSGSRIFIAGSSEIFGINQKEPVTCSTPTIYRTPMERQKQMRFISFMNFERIIVSMLALVFFLVTKALCVSSILCHRKLLWERVLLQRVNKINFTWVPFQRNAIGVGLLNM